MIDVGLYVLAGSLRASLTIAAGTIAAWWLLSDYYLARAFEWWTPFADMFAFVAASALLAVAIVYGCRRRILQCVNGVVLPVEPLPSDFSMNRAGYSLALSELTARPEMCRAAPFLVWQARRLHAIDDRVVLRPADVARSWFSTPRSLLRVWLVSLWLPLLWLLLIAMPRYTNATETLAALVQDSPTEIFDVIVSGHAPTAPGAGVPRRLTESVQSPDTSRLKRWSTTFVSNGFVDVHVTDFPRVYRRLDAICAGSSPACAVGGSSTAVDLAAGVPVRAGRARVHFIQTKHEAPLGLKLWLLRGDGGLLDEVTIEP